MASDPVERVLLASRLPRERDADVGKVLAESLARCSPGTREAVAVFAFETGLVERTFAAVAEEVGAVYAELTREYEFVTFAGPGTPKTLAWQRIERIFRRLDDNSEEDQRKAAVLARCFERGDLKSAEDADACLNAYSDTTHRLREFRNAA